MISFKTFLEYPEGEYELIGHDEKGNRVHDQKARVTTNKRGKQVVKYKKPGDKKERDLAWHRVGMLRQPATNPSGEKKYANFSFWASMPDK